LGEEVGSAERIEPAGGGSVRMDVEPGGAESVLRDVPGRRRGIEEVRHEAEQVDDQERVRERAHHVLPSAEEEQEDDGEVLADVDEVGEAASQVERGPMVRREEFVERLPGCAAPSSGKAAASLAGPGSANGRFRSAWSSDAHADSDLLLAAFLSGPLLIASAASADCPGSIGTRLIPVPVYSTEPNEGSTWG